MILHQASKWLPDRPATSAAAAELGEQGKQHCGRQDQQLWQVGKPVEQRQHCLAHGLRLGHHPRRPHQGGQRQGHQEQSWKGAPLLEVL